MRRREFVKLVGGSAVAWPFVARAQQPERMRRIGVLMGYAESDRQGQANIAAFRVGLQKLGWTEGRNVAIEYRWAAAEADLVQQFAKELVALQPDLILTQNTPITAAVLQQTRTIPIIFANVSDPVGSGFVAGLPRPGGNVTGLIDIDASFAVEAIAAPVRDTSELESVVAGHAREPDGGLIVMPEAFMNVHRAEVTSLAAHYRLPAVYPRRFFAEVGGLLSYGNDQSDNFRRAATYADRILHGAKANELPVEQPTKFELVINLKTAKALGLTVPVHLQQIADEVIE